MTFKAILFDFEGTLVDFQWKLEEGEAALRAGYAALGLPAEFVAGNNYCGLWNGALQEGRLSLEVLRAEMGPVYDRYDLDALSRWELRDGARALLETAGSRRLRCGIVSNIGRRALDPALERFGLETLIEMVVSRDDVPLMKPDPEGVRRCLAAWQISPAEALFVGDSLTDVRTARAAGTAVVILVGGESSAEALAANPPDFYADSLADVARLVT